MTVLSSPRGPSAAARRRALDVEDVLSWAYRDELPKRTDLGSACWSSSVSPMFRLAALGGRIDNWSREPGFPAALGDPHPDALLVEQAVQGLNSSPHP